MENLNLIEVGIILWIGDKYILTRRTLDILDVIYFIKMPRCVFDDEVFYNITSIRTVTDEKLELIFCNYDEFKLEYERASGSVIKQMKYVEIK